MASVRTEAEMLGEQHVLLQDQFAAGDQPGLAVAARDVGAVADEGMVLVLDAALVDQETATDGDLGGVFTEGSTFNSRMC